MNRSQEYFRPIDLNLLKKKKKITWLKINAFKGTSNILTR